ncbi:MAG: PDZ domain-containing protein [Chloroflexota bacterium]|nr:PDZ domain-containing protein [Chloroflexota bacterium]MDQ5866384.1 PDZ domain-containing protein [Chloroflexota bacterium]
MTNNHETTPCKCLAQTTHPNVKLPVLVQLLVVLVLGTLTLLAAACGGAAGESQMQNSEQIATVVIQEFTVAAPVIGVVVDRNLRVVDVEKGGAAEKAGIARGDVLRRLDTTPLANGPEAMQKFRERAITGQGLSVGLNRGGKDLQVQVLPIPPARQFGQPTPTAVPMDQFYF